MLNNKKKITLDEAFEQYHLALQYKSHGAYGRSIKILEETTQILYASSIENFDERHLIFMLQDELGEIYNILGNNREALNFFKKSILNISLLLKQEHQNIKLQEHQALRLLHIGIIYQNLNQLNNAIPYLKNAIITYERFIHLIKEKDRTILSMKRQIDKIKILLESASPNHRRINKVTIGLKNIHEYRQKGV